MASQETVPGSAGGERESARLAEDLGRVREALRGLQFGAVTVIVQDGVVVQIDRTEKVRVGRLSNGS